MPQQRRTALVTGANQGIGYEVCRQLGSQGLRIVLTARDPKAGRVAAERLAADGLNVRFELLDVSSEESVAACADRLRRDGEHIDILVNNAAIHHPGGILEMAREALQQTMDTNFFGAVWTCQAFIPSMQLAGYGRVVNVSSNSGAFSGRLSGPTAYSISKAALNAMTVKLAAEVRGDVKVNAADPGWVRTRMGGSGAPRSAEQAADTIVWLATLPADGPSGGFFRDRKRVPW